MRKIKTLLITLVVAFSIIFASCSAPDNTDVTVETLEENQEITQEEPQDIVKEELGSSENEDIEIGELI